MRSLRRVVWAACFLSLSVGSALGTAEDVPFVGTAEVVGIDMTHARVWTDEDGITHVRDAAVTLLVMVYDLDENLLFQGDGMLSLNYNIDYATGNGDVKTWDTIVYSNDEVTFTVEGHTEYDTYGWVIEDSGFNHHCREGEMAGMIATGEVFGIFGTPDRDLTGIMHYPHGVPLAGPEPRPAEASSWGTIKARFR